MEENLEGRAQEVQSDSVQEQKEGRSVYAEKEKDIPSYDWHRRVLSESKKAKSQLAEAQEELNVYRTKELEAKGQYQEIIESLRKQNNDLRSQVDERDQVYSWSKKTEAIKHAASQAGCVKSDHLLKLMDEDLFNSIQVDDNYNVVKEDVDRVVDSFKTSNEYDYLFRRNTASADSVTPGYKVDKKEPDLESLSLAEKLRLIGMK